MTTATYNTTSHDGLRRYLSDVGMAARAFAAALFAANERQLGTPVAKPTMSERMRMKSRMKLVAMANSYQDMHPSLASELRNLASRD